MKPLFKLFVVTAFLLGSATAQVSLAQPGGMDPETRIQQMITSLEVTKEQEPKFREVMNAYYGKLRESMGQGGGDRAAMMQTIQALQAEQEKNLAGVLNEAQMAKYKEQQAARRARMGQ